MNISQLKQLVDEAIERGIDPTCTVVIDVASIKDASDWAILKGVNDPSQNADYIWFSLVPGEEADGRFTPGHYAED